MLATTTATTSNNDFAQPLRRHAHAPQEQQGLLLPPALSGPPRGRPPGSGRRARQQAGVAAPRAGPLLGTSTSRGGEAATPSGHCARDSNMQIPREAQATDHHTTLSELETLTPRLLALTRFKRNHAYLSEIFSPPDPCSSPTVLDTSVHVLKGLGLPGLEARITMLLQKKNEMERESRGRIEKLEKQRERIAAVVQESSEGIGEVEEGDKAVQALKAKMEKVAGVRLAVWEPVKRVRLGHEESGTCLSPSTPSLRSPMTEERSSSGSFTDASKDSK